MKTLSKYLDITGDKRDCKGRKGIKKIKLWFGQVSRDRQHLEYIFILQRTDKDGALKMRSILSGGRKRVDDEMNHLE